MWRSQTDALFMQKTTAMLFWLLFVVLRLGFGKPALPTSLLLPSEPPLRLLLSGPARDASALVLRIEQGDGTSQRRTTLTAQLGGAQEFIALPAVQRRGRLKVKAVMLDQMGCIIYGAAVETMMDPRPVTPLLEIKLRKLDVPLCG